MTPKGAEVFFEGMYYKRVIKGESIKVFYHDNEEWRLSSVPPHEIEAAIHLAELERVKARLNQDALGVEPEPVKKLPNKDRILDFMAKAGRPVTMIDFLEGTDVNRVTIYVILGQMTGAEVRKVSFLARGATKRKTTAWELAA